MQLRRITWAGHMTCLGEKISVYKVLVWKPEGKRPLGTPVLTWEGIIKIDLWKIGWDGMDWIQVHQDREQRWTFVKTAGFISCWEILEWLNSY
jgi:hypothetical protein